MQTALPAAPAKPLLMLGLAVLAAHLLLLLNAPWPMRHEAPALAGPLITRTLVPAPPALPTRKSAPRSGRAPMPPPVLPAPAHETAPEAASPSVASASASQTAAQAEAEPAAPAVEASASPAAPEPPVAAVPGSTRLKYDITGTVRGLNYFAGGELLWRHDGQGYEARLEVGAFLLGSRVQTSRGQISAQGLEPRRFSDKVRSEVAAHFERDKGKIIFSANTPEAALQPGAQDHLSIFIQLASLLAGAPERYPSGSSIEMQAVGPRDAALWRFTVDGPEQLQLPGGAQATLKLTRPPTHPYDLKAELWLAPALGWLPARIRLTQDNGDFIDQQWVSSGVPAP